MADIRQKNKQWRCADNDGSINYRQAQLATMMDIRDELQALNRLLHCQNFIAIPRILGEIRRNTTKPKRKPAKK